MSGITEFYCFRLDESRYIVADLTVSLHMTLLKHSNKQVFCGKSVVGQIILKAGRKIQEFNSINGLEEKMA